MTTSSRTPALKTTTYDAIVLGAGGAGMMCALQAGQRGKSVLLLDHAEKIGHKILISGGGRCNFTNLGAKAERYISQNPHFCKSAMARFTPQDFIAMVNKYNIKYHEKKLGQQFCDDSAQQIVDMLLAECNDAGVTLRKGTFIESVSHENDTFTVTTSSGTFTAPKLVVATGGLSIPKMGATNLGYKLAYQFNHKVVTTEPALVPFTFSEKDLAFYTDLSGISFDALVRCGKVSFRENILLTHRGVSGPAILQISSYWNPGDEIHITLLPDLDWTQHLKTLRDAAPKKDLVAALSDKLATRFVEVYANLQKFPTKPCGMLSDKDIAHVVKALTNFTIKPNGTEGYRKAEVTRGGVDTSQLNANNLESKLVPGLHFIGEVVDVTGWLGGYNFQWAWASGAAAGRAL
ncbi:MAG: aminoacetone oxidase family FAD-binding enzyme [Pseudomonas fluorescens]|nr:MAG: aminoacetone oxidase family FAD-binding enzyme [Pseudomonas fluorescens]